MRVALLSAGPSLARTYDPDAHYDLRIGVNTAVRFHYCDWWSCADEHRFASIDSDGVIGLPKVWMIDDQRDRVQCFHPEKFARYKWAGWNATFEETGANKAWANASAPCALILAKSLGATEIDCYGVDMAGGLDVSQKIDESSRCRNDARWATEVTLWNQIVAWVQDRGVKVNRINGILTHANA